MIAEVSAHAARDNKKVPYSQKNKKIKELTDLEIERTKRKKPSLYVPRVSLTLQEPRI